MTFERKMKCFLLCCLLSCAIGCSTRSSGAGNANGPGEGGKAGVTAGDSPLDAITKALHAQFGVKSYRVRMTTTLSDGNTHSRLIEFVAPDRFHMVSDKDETIVVGPSTYMKRASGPWMKSPVDMGSMMAAFRDPKMEEELRQSTEVKLIGADTLDGMPMLVYQYTLTKAMGMDLRSVTKTWVSVVDSLPRKSESEGEFQGVKSKTTNLFYDYNADIKIESPM